MSVSKVSILRFGELVMKGDSIHLFALSVISTLGVTVRLVFLFQPMRYHEAFSFTNCVSRTPSVEAFGDSDDCCHYFYQRV